MESVKEIRKTTSQNEKLEKAREKNRLRKKKSRRKDKNWVITGTFV